MLEWLQRRKKIGLLVAGGVLVLLALALFVRPAVEGFVTKDTSGVDLPTSLPEAQERVLELEQELTASKAAVESCTAARDQIITSIETISTNFASCQGELSALQVRLDFAQGEKLTEQEALEARKDQEITSLQVQVDDASEELDEVKDELSDVERDYEALVENLARNKCCKAKLDSPGINSYDIVDNDILCSDQGSVTLSC